MDTRNHNNPTGEFTGKHMLLSMIAFFGVIIAVNFTMASLATGSWTGLVVKNSYVASQNFNEELEQANAQRRDGLVSDLSYRGQTLKFILKDRTGNVLKPKNVSAVIGRPAFEQADRTIELKRFPDNSYRLDTKLDPGIWMIKITGETAKSRYRRDARLYIDSTGSGKIQ